MEPSKTGVDGSMDLGAAVPDGPAFIKADKHAQNEARAMRRAQSETIGGPANTRRGLSLFVRIVAPLCVTALTIFLLFQFLGWCEANDPDRISEHSSVDLDASACFALYNTGILLHGFSEVPPTKTISDALALGPQGPEPVSVVRLSPWAVGVKFPDSVVKAYPSLARDYGSLSLSALRDHATSCPHSPGAQAIFRRLVSDAYPA